MASSQETPRQKLIGMMYLVLTALLAMNVAKEVLNSYTVINEGLEQTNNNFQTKINDTYQLFQKALAKDPKKVQEYWQKAQVIQKTSNKTYQYIEELKKNIITQTAGYEGNVPDSLFELRNIESKDDYNVPTQILIGADAVQPKSAEIQWSALELKSELSQFKQEVLRQFPSNHPLYHSLNNQINFKDVQISQTEVEPWHLGNFYHIPLAAIVTNLTKMQNDVRNMEAEAIQGLFAQINSTDYNFDKLEAKVIAHSNYIMLGDSFKAEVFVAAHSSTLDPLIEISQHIDENGNITGNLDQEHIYIVPGSGKGEYKFKPNKPGVLEWGGIIKVKKPGEDEGFDEYKIPMQKILVAQPALVVQPIKMNKMYRGIENPISISLPGVPTEDLKISVSNGRITSSSNGIYNVVPGNDPTTKVNVSIEQNGKTKTFSSIDFKVRNLPLPRASANGLSGDAQANNFTARNILGIRADMGPDFDFDLNFKVISFQIEANYGTKKLEKTIKGNKIPDDTKKLLQSTFSRSGSKIYFSDIIAKGPNGNVRLDPIKVTVN